MANIDLNIIIMLKHGIFYQFFLVSKQLKKLTLSTKLQHVRYATAIAADKEYVLDRAELENAKPFEEMPSFYMLPYFGTVWINFPLIGFYNVHEHHKALIDKRRRLGDVMREKIGPMNIVMTFNPDDMQTIFKHEGQYPFRGEFTALKAYRESRKEWYSTSGLTCLQGKEWHDLRTKAQKHLMKPKAIQAYLHPMQDVARDFVTNILAIRDSRNEVPDFLGELYKWALESVAVVGLDTRLRCFDRNIAADTDGLKMINAVQTKFDCINKLEAMMGNIQYWKFFPTPTWKKFTKAADTFTEIAFKYINRSLEALNKTAENDDKEMTLLQSLIVTKGLHVSGAMVTVADMLLAGIDTTAHSIGFFLYTMARNPEKQERLYEEITKVLPRKEDRITTSVFNELKYLKACIKESQRLYPIAVGLARSVDQDVVISGYRVPARTLIGVGLQVICTDEKYFKNPNQYLPERWLDKNESFHPFSFLPFGFGTRSCIGRRLAELEIISLAAEIIRNFKITYHHEDLGMFQRLINTPDKPLRFNFVQR